MRIGVVGGGICGLTAAYELSKRGHEVSVFESRPELGGQAGTFTMHGGRLEVFYHHLFSTDNDVLSLVDELGLAPRMQWIDSKVGFYHGGRIYDFVTPLDLLRFKPVGLLDRVRLGLVGLYLRRYKDWRKLEDVTAREWIRRWAGRRNYDVVWGPLLRGKFGEKADEVGMVWFWGKIHLRFASRRGQRECLGYMDGSFGLLVDELAARVRARGGRVYVASPVEHVAIEDGRARGVVVAPGGLGEGVAAPGRHEFDAVLATVPSPAFLRMAPEVGGAYAERLRSVTYQSAVCLVLALERSLSPMYWLNISAPDIPFVGAIEHTNFIDRGRYGGAHVLYLSNYLALESHLARMSKDELLAEYLPHLRKLNPAFEEGWVKQSWLFRDEAGQPVVTRRYSEKLVAHETPVAGLYLGNTTQIYPEDRGVNYSVRLGRRLAALPGLSTGE